MISDKKAVYYVAFSEILYEEEIGAYTSYGICAMRGEKVLMRVSDLSVDGEAVEVFARRLTAGELALEQLPDAVEDFLGNF